MKLHSLKATSIQAIALVCISTLMTSAQPEHRPAQDRSADTQQHDRRDTDRPQRPGKKMLEIRINADALRARLNRSIAREEMTLEVHRSALAKLDEGASPSEVLAAMKIQGFARKAGNAGNEHRGPGSGGGPGVRPSADGPRNGSGRLSTEDREELHLFLQINFPELWNNLQPIAKLNPQSADRLLARMAPQIREILLLRESQPDLAALKIEEMHAGLKFVETSRLYRAAMNNPSTSDSDRADAMSRLRAAATQRFDIQFKAKQHEISMLEARLNELKSSVNEIEHRRDSEVDRMVASASKSPRSSTNQKKKTSAQPQSGND